MSEADFQQRFSRWLKYTWKKTAAFELKLCRKGALAFSALAPHQRTALLNAYRGVITYKIPDTGVLQKPFDCFTMSNVMAFVVVMFYKRGCKDFYIIDIEAWIAEENGSDRKSLTEKRAGEIGAKFSFN